MEVEIYRHKRRKSFIPDKNSFTRDGYQIIGWNEYDHKDNLIPDYPINIPTSKGFLKDIDLYSCWGKIEYFIYYFDKNPNLIRTEFINDDFFIIGTDNKDFIGYDKQDGIQMKIVNQTPNSTILPSPEQIGMEIPSGYTLDKWVDQKGNEYNIGDSIQNTGYDKILYAKWKEYDNLIDNDQNDIIDKDGFDIEISKN